MFLAALLIAAAQTAPAPQVAPDAETAKPVKEKKICKTDPNLTGTRMRKRLCLTETEWAQKNATSANDLKTRGAR